MAKRGKVSIRVSRKEVTEDQGKVTVKVTSGDKKFDIGGGAPKVITAVSRRGVPEVERRVEEMGSGIDV